MIAASLYIIVCGAKNRIRLRLRRLKEPRYLFGTIAAAVYLYFTVFARMFGRSARSQGRRRALQATPMPFEMLRAGGPTFVGLALLVMMAAGWLFPPDGGLLDFSAAETQILFPAPVSRRALIVHRLMRSQLGLLFAAIVPALVLPTGSGLSRATFAISMWVIFATIRVHFTGVSLARASLALPGADASRRQWGALVVMLGALAIVGQAVWRSFASHPVTGAADILDRLSEAGTTGLARWILWPFVALARPLFAPWPGPYLVALATAFAILALNVAWVLSSDEAFQEAAAQAEARRAAIKRRRRPVVRARTAGWRLAPAGRPEGVFAWKNAMQILRNMTGASAMRYVGPLVGVTIGATSGLVAATRATGLAALFGLVALAVAAFAIVLGPQVVRNDLREDLLHLELLKTWPVSPSSVVRGEMMAPAALLTIIAWAAILSALAVSAAAFTTVSFSLRASIAATLAIVAPAMIAAQFTVHNAAAVFFPAWVPLGSQRPRGLDAMGQRLILFFGIVFTLALMLLPGLVPAGVVWLVLTPLLGHLAFVPAAAVLTAIVLVEVFVATEVLGPAFERLDLTAVERAE
jgi:ABC-2 type transport system permease protein